jgi:hypothetical protein
MYVVHSNYEARRKETRHDSTATSSLYCGGTCVIKFLVLLYLEVVSAKYFNELILLSFTALTKFTLWNGSNKLKLH